MNSEFVTRRLLAPILVLLALVSTWSQSGAAEALHGRVALVIGNAAYQHVAKLANPANDAVLMGRTLGRLGFTLVGGGPLTDLDKPRFDAAVEAFGRAMQGAEVALFYYSGHGLQVDGANWLVPVGANPSRRQDLDFQMVNADLVLRQMDGAGTRLNLVILDACRNNPFDGRGLRAAGGGLSQMSAPQGTLISYATQPGNVAEDGVGADSPFTEALAESLNEPGLDIFHLFNRVGLTVKRLTGGQQQPWVSNSPIDGDFYFSPPSASPSGGPSVAMTPALPEPSVRPPSFGPVPGQTRPAALARPFDEGPVMGQPGWMVSLDSGCWVRPYLRAPGPSVAIRWSGSCVAGFASGPGVLDFEARGKRVWRFVGTIDRGLLSGRGVMVWTDGTRYDGDWVGSTPQGSGALTLAHGAKYDGNWFGGCFTEGTRTVAVMRTEAECRRH